MKSKQKVIEFFLKLDEYHVIRLPFWEAVKAGSGHSGQQPSWATAGEEASPIPWTVVVWVTTLPTSYRRHQTPLRLPPGASTRQKTATVSAQFSRG